MKHKQQMYTALLKATGFVSV